MKTVVVKPAGDGWIVDCNEVAPLFFRDGGPAERTARRLAGVLGWGDSQSQVLVHDRTGVVVGSVVYGPDGRGGRVAG